MRVYGDNEVRIYKASQYPVPYVFKDLLNAVSRSVDCATGRLGLIVPVKVRVRVRVRAAILASSCLGT